MSQQAENVASLPILRPLNPLPPLGFWSRIGSCIAGSVSCVGEGLVAAYEFVDGDLRRELASLPLMAITAIGPRHAEVRAKKDDGERPVIFVHGMSGHRGNFHPMGAFFRTRGRRRLYSVGLPVGDADLHADHLGRFIDEVLVANALPDGQVDIVAHSRGGVVARIALNNLETNGKIATLVTIGTPHGGTMAARYGRSRELDELRPDSPIVARLEQQLPWNGPRLVCLWSAADPLVVPPTNAQVVGAENVELPGLTHCQLLLWPAGWRAAYEAISEV
jgi:pimeloyl-ACP methyl ester carboxylesterase